MYYLTLGSCLKNEELYIEDFVRYHENIGIEKFIFFDRTYYPIKELFKNKTNVEIVHFPEGGDNIHQEAWGQLIKYNQGKTKWLGLIDADQCLVPVKTDDVRDILQNYEEFASLQINWKTFGSSFQETKLPRSIYERFLLCAKQDTIYNYHTQFICQPDRTLPFRTPEPHYPVLPLEEKSVNTNKETINPNKIVSLNPGSPLSFNVPVLHDVLYVNHYTNKSREEFLIKNNKGRADIFGSKMPIDQFNEYDIFCNQEKCTRALELWNKAQKM